MTPYWATMLLAVGVVALGTVALATLAIMVIEQWPELRAWAQEKWVEVRALIRRRPSVGEF